MKLCLIKVGKLDACIRPIWSHLISYTSVPCSLLFDPNNGSINCSLGDDGVTSYEDTCSFTCNTDYELTGSDTRTCQSNGSWSGSDGVCRRGIYMIITYNFVIFDNNNVCINS